MLRCEVGDLSGKHARLNVGSGKQFYTDPSLPLFGEMSGKGKTLTPTYISIVSGVDPGFFLGGGALVSFSTSTPINHIVFFWQNTSCIRKPQVISGRGGVRTPCTLPLDPPLVSPEVLLCITKVGSGNSPRLSKKRKMVLLNHQSVFMTTCSS